MAHRPANEDVEEALKELERFSIWCSEEHPDTPAPVSANETRSSRPQSYASVTNSVEERVVRDQSQMHNISAGRCYYAATNQKTTTLLPCAMNLEANKLRINAEFESHPIHKEIDLKQVSFTQTVKCHGEIHQGEDHNKAPAPEPAEPLASHTANVSTVRLRTLWIRTTTEDVYITHEDEREAQRFASDLKLAWISAVGSGPAANCE
ncbi:hypothetical protein SVAN01_04939 [Stagonosporopsis vannaccii]|nr:hypothetical protein SVAN01_04939 [Stagonosporopsis vannaccii]